MHQPGTKIAFKLDFWKDNKHFTKKVEASVISICADPLGRHQTKYIVKYKNVKYGIPVNSVLQQSIQLKLL